MNLCRYYESCSWKPFTWSKWSNEIIWGYKNLDYHWHHCQFVISPHITKIWLLLTHKKHIEKKKKCWYLRFNPIDILTTMPIVTQKPKTNGQFLAPSDNATTIIDLPTTGGFAMNFYFSFLTPCFVLSIFEIRTKKKQLQIVIVIRSLPSTKANWTFFQRQKNQTK